MYRTLWVLLLFGLSHCQSDEISKGDNVLSEEDAKKEMELINVLTQIFGTPPDSFTSTTVAAIPESQEREEAVIKKTPECRTANGNTGQCMPPENCKNNQGTDYKRNCTEKSEICCPLNTGDMDFKQPELKTFETKACGARNPLGIESIRILSNINETKFAEFPWIVAVLRVVPVDDTKPNGEKVFVYTCGGSLIHPSVVLTTAHHIDMNMTLKVRAGEWDTTTTDEIYPHQDRKVDRVIRHELYNTTRRNLYYDIALLILDQPVDLAPNVATVCLPPPMQRAPAGARCLSSGWGKNNFGKSGKYQVILKKVELPVVDRDTCQNIFRNTRLGPLFKLHGSFMCAGGEPGKDTCTGDGGSPLVCPIPSQSNRYMQNGMVAWGLGCGDEFPAAYVDVGYLRPWIDRQMIAAGFRTDTYTF